MKLSSALLTASLGLVFAHGDHDGQHVPKILGGRKFLSELAARQNLTPGHQPIVGPRYSTSSSKRETHGVQKRQGNTSGKCGGSSGSCAAGYCCSAEGWCGKGKDYCSAPDCQINYGPACDGNQKPSGVDTSGVARPKLGKVLYGGNGIYDCINAGDIALTFDDGPYLYTNDLLDKLASYGARATFFITGTNIGKGMINDPSTPYPAIIKRMHAEGHQVASHTWSHQNASQLTNTQFTNQMVWNEIAINSILGFFPTYMRPPYSICAKECQTILATLGYHTTYFNLDTAGYLNDNAKTIQTSKNIWDEAIRDSDPEVDSFLQIEHDIHSQIVYNLTDYILTSLYSSGYNAVTVGECLGDPKENWYRAGPGGSVPSPSPTRATAITSTTAPPAPTKTSTDGVCGNGVTCAGTRWGACCSKNGFCGVGDEYCAYSSGCQPLYGRCDGTPVVVSSSSSSAARPTSSSTTSSRRSSTSTTAPRSSTSTVSIRTTVVRSSSTSTKSTPTPTPVGPAISVNGDCGPDVDQTCTGSRFGTCCGPSNRCSSNTIACLAILGCQAEYGKCI